MKTILLIAALSFFAAGVNFVVADELALKDDHPKTYVVKKGDTLWDISGLYLKEPWNWPVLWNYNPQIANPHLIYPGDELHLIYIDGQPRLVVNRGGLSGGTVKLTPAARIGELDQAIPAIPMDQIQPFLRSQRVLTQADLDSAPYVVAGAGGHLLSGVGDQFYARGSFDNTEPALGIYRRGSLYVDPLTEEVLGLQAMDIGSARLDDLQSDLATLSVTRMVEEVRNGDRLIRDEDRVVSASFVPRSPDSEVDALMIAVEGGVSQIGALSVVAINRGRREGMQEGHVLAIYSAGELIPDPIAEDMIQMPDVRSGLVMIFRTFEKLSYGIVLRSDRPLAVMDKVRTP